MPPEQAQGTDQTAQALLDSLRKPNDRWCLATVLAWLMTAGRREADPFKLIQMLCDRLVGCGAPLWRVSMTFGTLHPQVLAKTYVWIRDQGVQQLNRLHGVQQSDDYLGSPVQTILEQRAQVRQSLTDLDPDRHHSVFFSLARQGATDYFGLPIAFSNGDSNVLIFATDHASGFDTQDVRQLEVLAEFVAPVLEVIATRDLARSLLDTYVGRRTGARVLQGRIKRGDGEHIHAAMWFSDLRDFTALTESLTSQALLATLNAYFEHVAAAVTARNGEILRFIGDAMLIVFPAEGGHALPQACGAALDAAEDAFSTLEALNHRRTRRREPPIRFGVGLHVGEVIYGNVGAPDRLDFTVMGPAVNRTARLESLTKDVGVPLLMSWEFVTELNRNAAVKKVQSRGLHAMKGIKDAQEVFAALAD